MDKKSHVGKRMQALLDKSISTVQVADVEEKSKSKSVSLPVSRKDTFSKPTKQTAIPKISNSDIGVEVDTEDLSKVDLIYRFFKVSYQSRFTASIKTKEDITDWKRVWSLAVHQFDLKHIQRCLYDIVKDYYWPPSPIEFAEFCKIRLSGKEMPCAEFAYSEACNNSASPSRSQWSHPVVYWAGKHVGWYALRMSDKASIFPLFNSTYERMKADYINDRLPPIPDGCAQNSAHEESAMAEKLTTKRMNTGVNEVMKIREMNPNVSKKDIYRLFYFLTLPKGLVRSGLMARSKVEIESRGIKCSGDVFL